MEESRPEEPQQPQTEPQPYPVGVDSEGTLLLSDGTYQHRNNEPGQTPAGQSPEWIDRPPNTTEHE